MMRTVIVVTVLLVVATEAKIWASPKNDPGCNPVPNDQNGTDSPDGINQMYHWRAEEIRHGATVMWNAAVEQNDHSTNPDPTSPKELFAFEAWWNLTTRPRRPILIIEDMNEGYRPYLGYLIDKIQPLIAKFRALGLPILWSTWARRWNDGAYGSNDRFYSPQSDLQDSNPMYVYGDNGIDVMQEVKPTTACEEKFILESMHLSKFNDRYEDGSHILPPILDQMGIDTVVMTGGWSEDCILGTIADAADAWGLDAIAIFDGIGTATPEHRHAMSIINASYGLVRTSKEIVDFLDETNNDYFLKPVIPQCDVQIRDTTEPDWQSHYMSAKKFFNHSLEEREKIIHEPKRLAEEEALLEVEQDITTPSLNNALQTEIRKLRAENFRLKGQLRQANRRNQRNAKPAVQDQLIPESEIEDFV